MIAQRVWVLGREYKIVLRDSIEDDEGFQSGLCLNVDREIHLEKLPKTEMEGNLAHEMFHAGLDISGLSTMLEPKVEEALCQLFRAVAEDWRKSLR